jgi:hypothetical protein
MKFMLMMNAPRGTGDWGLSKWSPDDLRAHIGFMKTFAESLKKEGALLAAEGLAMPGEARIVRAGKDGKPEVTDGPFAEAKEIVGGYAIVEAKSKDEAVDIARRFMELHRIHWPEFECEGEVRGIQELS